MIYESPAALEMAIKAAAKVSPCDTNRAISAFYLHRFLYRIFMENNCSFVLKGGRAMLARTLDARATRDIDLLSKLDTLNEALEYVKALSQVHTGDFITFEFLNCHPIKANDEYRNGINMHFLSIIGAKPTQTISIDLVVDAIPLEDIERITPVDRINVQGLPVCDYLVYPVESALADKLCALFETYQGIPSSRVKDLVDIVVYARISNIDGAKLQNRIHHEAKMRKLTLGQKFTLPTSWGKNHASQFTKLCTQTQLPKSLWNLEAACQLASTLFEPAIQNNALNLYWSSRQLKWLNKTTFTP